MRKITLLAANWAGKSGCRRLQPGASVLPAMENRLCTPPSGLPSGCWMNLASLTGPFAVINDGIVFHAPISAAAAICGFGWGTWGLAGLGLDPRVAGWEWHEPQLVLLNPGPSPPLPWGTSSTGSSSTN